MDNFRTVLSLRRTADMQIIIEYKTPLFGKRIASHSSPSSVLNVTGGFPFPDGPPTDETPVLRGVSPLLWSLSPKGRSDSFRQKSKCLGIRGQISRSAQTTHSVLRNQSHRWGVWEPTSETQVSPALTSPRELKIFPSPMPVQVCRLRAFTH